MFIAYIFLLVWGLIFSSFSVNSFQHATNLSFEHNTSTKITTISKITTTYERQTTGSVIGYIYTNTGVPIANANVSAYNFSIGRFSTNANSAGYYSITNLPVGEYQLSAWAPGREFDVNYSVNVPYSGSVSVSFYLGPSGVISGTVVTRTYTPIPNAQVRLSISAINTTIIKTTNSLGQFQFSDYLATGEYTLYTNADGFIQLTSRIHVNSGSTTNVQFVLNRSATISGSVKDDLGNPLNGIYVIAYNNTYMGANFSTSGNYIIDHNLGDGIYYLEAYGEGYVRRNFIGPVNVALEGSATCNIVLNRSAKIHGTVRNTQGYGIQNARIELNGIDAGVMLTEYTDIAGNYMFDTNLSAGRYVMFLSATGYVSKSIPQFSLGFAEDRTIQITLNRTGKIYGIVQDQYGAPVVGAQVTAYAQNILGTLTNTTDSTGSYSLLGLDAGIYQVYAQANGYVSSGYTTATLSEGQNLSVNLKLNATGCINGSVSDSTGNPIPYALVTAKDAFGVEYTTVTNTSGLYSLKGTLPAGIYDVIVTANGYNKAVQNGLNVPKFGVVYANFILYPLGKVSGTIYDENSNPISGAKVTLLSLLGKAYNMSTYSNGTFSFGYPLDIQEGEYKLLVSAIGFANYTSSNFMVRPGEIYWTNITLTRIFTLSTPSNMQNFTSPYIQISGTAVQDASLSIIIQSSSTGEERVYVPTINSNGIFSVQAEIFSGRNIITIDGKINNDNNNTLRVSRTVFLTIPSLTIVSPLNGTTITSKTLIVSGTALNYLGGLDVSVFAKLDSEEYTPAIGNGSWIWYKELTYSMNGQHTIFVKAIDSLGTVVKTTSIIVNIPPREIGVKIEPYNNNVTSEGGVVSCKFRIINTGNELDSYRITANVNKLWSCKIVGNGTVSNVRDGTSEFVSIKVTFPNSNSHAILTVSAVSLTDNSVESMAEMHLYSTERQSPGEINMLPIFLMFVIVAIIIIFGMYTWKKALEPQDEEVYDTAASKYFSSYDLAIEKSRSHSNEYAGSGYAQSYNGNIVKTKHFATYGEENISYTAGERMEQKRE